MFLGIGQTETLTLLEGAFGAYFGYSKVINSLTSYSPYHLKNNLVIENSNRKKWAKQNHLLIPSYVE